MLSEAYTHSMYYGEHGVGGFVGEGGGGGETAGYKLFDIKAPLSSLNSYPRVR